MLINTEVIIRLVLSALLGGIIGMEREVNNRPAGLRTHILVTVGAALVMLISMDGFLGGDPARLAAQVVSGIGFLGAGTILVQGQSIHGLTTAASLWVCACIGLAIGNGYYMGGIVTFLIVLFTLMTLGFFEKRVLKSSYKTLHIIGYEKPGLIGEIGTLLGNEKIIIKHIELSPVADEIKIGGNIHIDMAIKLPYKYECTNLFEDIKLIEGVSFVQWESHVRGL
ncbi:MgtC/SapB family protein [Anaeromicrobium sediminis]|uniref:Methyltransferase n=1 Tax=Anaeromicrobium sediminis TaxID=1478221 RepID=A0A267MMJ5_9FIRM|nr:MgtC/SapB family protein [Anaeromicrobium sediminis]PAB60632.1 methyltransferase [Anaeromicrobium sediminis]